MLKAEELYFSPVIENITFDVLPGHCLCLFGPNGTGKSTLLKILAGILPLTEGRILYNKKDLSQVSLQEWTNQVAWLPQSLPRVFSRMRVQDFLENSVSYDSKIDHNSLVSLFQMEGLMKTPLEQLSEGEWRRAQIIKIFSHAANRSIILLDEPEVSLDNGSKRMLLNLCQEFLTQNKILLLSSHNTVFSKHIATHFLLLKKGTNYAKFSKESEYADRLWEDNLYT